MSIETIPRDKHVFIPGMTGSGKSFFCEHFLRSYPFVVKLDTKNEVEERRRAGLSPWDGLKENEDFSVCYEFDKLDEMETGKIIFCPDYDFQEPDDLNDFFRWIFLRENTVLWIDELMGFTSAHFCPKELARLLQQGRSKNIGVWSCSQRPSSIPQIITANCTYFFVFYLNLLQDRKRMVDITGCPEMMNPPTNHKFWYYKVAMEKPVLCRLDV